MSSAWGCPHDVNGICMRVQGSHCAPGMRGCELEGKVRFADPAMNLPRKPVRAAPAAEPEAAPRDKAVARPRRRLPF